MSTGTKPITRLLRRRALIAGLATLPLARGAFAQAPPPKLPVVALVKSGAAGLDTTRDAFIDAMRHLGYGDGRNVRYDIVYYGSDLGRLPSLAAGLVNSGVAVIVTTGTPSIRVFQAATKQIPIIMAGVGDPVALGYVQSVARPGGNITGFTIASGPIMAKRIEIIKDMMPSIAKIAYLEFPGYSMLARTRTAADTTARSLKVQIGYFDLAAGADIDAAFEAMIAWGADAVMVADSPLSSGSMLNSTIAAGARMRRPLVCGFRALAEAGCLFSYGVNSQDLWRRVAGYVDKILRGEKAADLPVQEPEKYELLINLKTAKALGISMPPTMLMRADEVIE